MEALNAGGLRPISALLSDRKQEPRKNPTLYPIPQQKSSNSSHRIQQAGAVLVSSLLSSGLAAKALTYEEALQQSVDKSGGDLGFDVGGAVSGVVSFAAENPVAFAGGVVVLAVPLVLSGLGKKAKAWGVESAKSAYARLGEDASAELVDIRASGEIRKVGRPDVRGLGKKSVAIVYRGEDKPGFLKKLALNFKEPESTTLLVLDKFDGNSELVAELVTVNGFKAAYAIKDGVEGPRGWLNSGLPWIAPKKGFDLSSLTDAISGVLGDGVDGLSVVLGVAAATGLGFLAYTEVETILQFLGAAGIIQFVSKKLLIAEDRKKTLQEVDEFLTTKIAPKDFADDIKLIGKAVLPNLTSKALPPPTESESLAQTISEPKLEPKVEIVPEPKIEAIAEPKVEAIAEPVKEVNSDKPEPRPYFSSPFPYYPDFKPPTSPTPSPP